MKKNLLWQLLMLLIPFAGLAQADPPVLKEVLKKSEDIRSVEINANEHVFLAELKNDQVELINVTDKMQIKWRVTISGRLMYCGKLKEKILIVSTVGKDKDLNYEGILVDPANGSELRRNTFYNVDKEYDEDIKFFITNGGENLKVVARRSERLRKTGFFDAMKNYNRYSSTKDMSVFDVNETLTVKDKVNLPTNGGLLFNTEVNSLGTLFLSWYKDSGTIEVEKIEAGKSARSGSITYPFKISDSEFFGPYSHGVQMVASKTDPAVIYLAMIYQDARKNMELSLVKFNFSNMSHQVLSEKIDKDALKVIENDYTQFNNKVSKPALGYSGGMEVNFIDEEKGNLVLAIASNSSQSSSVYSGAAYHYLQSPIVSVYGTDLKMKSRQLIPSSLVTNNKNYNMPHVSYRLNDQKLYYIANSAIGINLITALYGVIDLNSGKYLKQEYLPKEQIRKPWGMCNKVMWFGRSFIVPYAYFKNSWEEDISFQLNSY